MTEALREPAREVVRFYGTDRTWSLLYRTLLGSRIDDLEAALALPAPAPTPVDDLGAAWADAEAALPDGWAIRIMTCRCLGGDHANWHVSASEDLSGWADPKVYVEGTPAAALRALALRVQSPVDR